MSSGVAYLYVIGGDGLPYVKIGTSADLQRRVRELQSGSPFTLSVLWFCEGDYVLEQSLHRVFADLRIRGEWFDLASLGDPVEAVQQAVRTVKAQEEHTDHPWGRVCRSIRCVWCTDA